MQHTLSKDLIALSSMLLMAQERGEVIRIAGELNTLIQSAMELEKAQNYNFSDNKRKALSASIKFTIQEVNQMSKTFKKEFIANGCTGRIIKRPSGKKGFLYEIRYRRNGYNISVSNTDLPTAKLLFIKATHNLNSPETTELNNLKFGKIIESWLNYKKDKVTYHTWENCCSRIKRFIPDDLKEKRIKDITTSDIDEFLRQYKSNPRFYEELRSILNQTFKFAIASGIVTHNPVTLIPFKKAKRVTRNSLSTEQTVEFLARIKEPEFDRIRQSAYVFYFFGIRPCELDNEARFEKDFFICRNRKRKGGAIEYKKIPIPKQARDFIDFDKPIVLPLSYPKSLDLFKKIFTDDEITFYNLRHTFASTCAEFVREDIVELWMGDSPERLVGKTYIHFKDEFMISQMDKVKFITV